MPNPEQLGGVPEEYRGESEVEAPEEKESHEEKGSLTDEEIEELQLLEGPDMTADRESHIYFFELINESVSIQDRRVMIRRLTELRSKRDAELRSIRGPRIEELGDLEEYFREMTEAKEKWATLSQDEKTKSQERLERLTRRGNFDFTGRDKRAIDGPRLHDYFHELSRSKKDIPESEWKSGRFG